MEITIFFQTPHTNFVRTFASKIFLMISQWMKRFRIILFCLESRFVSQSKKIEVDVFLLRVESLVCAQSGLLPGTKQVCVINVYIEEYI